MSTKRKHKAKPDHIRAYAIQELTNQLRDAVAQRDAALIEMNSQRDRFRAELDRVVAAFADTVGAIRKAYDVR